MDPVPYRSVRKYGAGTGETIGVITDIHASVTLELGTGSYLFDDVIQVVGAGGQFSTGGDSGALVVDALTRRPIGLIIGGKGNRSFAEPNQGHSGALRGSTRRQEARPDRGSIGEDTSEDSL